MITHRKLTIALTALSTLSAAAASAEIYRSAPERIWQVPDDPRRVEVEIWTDRGDGSRYCAGEPIEVFFRTTADAWVAIYDVDTRGRITRLFPARHAADNFVKGGVTHRLPSRYGYHFEVEGPAGWETLRAVASTNRRALLRHDWEDDWKDDRWDGRRGGYDRVPARYRPAPPASSRVTAVPDAIREVPDAIREVPDGPRDYPRVAVAETRHYVRDGARCRTRGPSRPWWHRR